MSAWLAHSLRSRGHTWATIALCSIVLRQGQTSHAHSEAEAILEQRLLFVSLCEARMAFKRLWGIIVRIIPEASWYIWTACRRHGGLTAGQPLQCLEWKRPLGAVKHLDSMQEAWGTLQPLLRRLCLGSSQHGAEPNECPLILIAGKTSGTTSRSVFCTFWRFGGLSNQLSVYWTCYLCVKSAMYWTSYLCIEQSIYLSNQLSIKPHIYWTIYLSNHLSIYQKMVKN